MTRRALITGGARRLGRAMTLALAAEGIEVVVHYHTSRDDAEAVAAEARQHGVAAWTATANLGDRRAVDGFVGRVADRCGELDLLVNSASTFAPSTLADVPLGDVDRDLQVNALAPLCLARELAARQRPAHVVNLLDARITGMDAHHAAYFISKRALYTLTRMMALELAPAVRVNAVAPGLVLPPEGKDTGYLETLAKNIPLQRHGEAADVAAALRFLVNSPFVTGQVIFVDGGQHLLGASYG